MTSLVRGLLSQHALRKVIPSLAVLALSVGCADDSSTPPAAPDSSSPATCTEGGKTYAAGANWDCSDGCNRCHCEESGAVLATGEACGCVDGPGRFFTVGSTWTCADGCNTCKCVAHGMISTTLVECDAGTDAGGDATDAAND